MTSDDDTADLDSDWIDLSSLTLDDRKMDVFRNVMSFLATLQPNTPKPQLWLNRQNWYSIAPENEREKDASLENTEVEDPVWMEFAKLDETRRQQQKEREEQEEREEREEAKRKADEEEVLRQQQEEREKEAKRKADEEEALRQQREKQKEQALRKDEQRRGAQKEREVNELRERENTANLVNFYQTTNLAYDNKHEIDLDGTNISRENDNDEPFSDDEKDF
jgi:hypothetical protein